MARKFLCSLWRSKFQVKWDQKDHVQLSQTAHWCQPKLHRNAVLTTTTLTIIIRPVRWMKDWACYRSWKIEKLQVKRFCWLHLIIWRNLAGDQVLSLEMSLALLLVTAIHKVFHQLMWTTKAMTHKLRMWKKDIGEWKAVDRKMITKVNTIIFYGSREY